MAKIEKVNMSLKCYNKILYIIIHKMISKLLS